LPLVFLVEPSRAAVSVMRKPIDCEADAVVEGPLFLLLALLEGRCDADALFFSRSLTVTGDMEAILALRNALDGCEIDLPRDLGASAGPLAPLVSRSVEAIRRRALEGEDAAWN
jgi:predicted lipid carrier protein YhbT